MSPESIHLDLGCGLTLRNPYKQTTLWGVDICAEVAQKNENVKTADLTFEKIPFEDDFFDSVSAYDFLEHIPRVLATSDNSKTRFPFIELMNEVWRVLKPGGLFYATTPGYPREEAFVDPTHVNIISRNSHIYFTIPLCIASIYGFSGSFKAHRVGWMRPTFEYEPQKASFSYRFKKLKNIIKRRNSHLLWEFESIK